jgi:hypothetical protein
LNSGYATNQLTAAPGQVYGLGAYLDPTTIANAPGTYTTNIIITGNFAGSPKTIPVTLTVVAAPVQAPIAVPTCSNLWWFDSQTTGCSQKQFCGAYMYQGLRTFGSQADCQAALPVPSVASISQVQNLTASASGNTVSLSWSAASASNGVGAYSVYRSTIAGFTPSASSMIMQTNALSYIDSAPAAGTYYYVVVAQDVNGNIGPASAQANITVSTAGGGGNGGGGKPNKVTQPVFNITSNSDASNQTAIISQSLQNLLNQLGGLLKSL